MIRVKQNVNLFGWAHCMVVTDGKTKLVVTTDVGPRVIWAGHANDPIESETNVFGGCYDHLGKSGGKEFKLYTGDRTWYAPEEAGPKTYDADNHQVAEVVIDDTSVTIVQKPGFAGLSKVLKIRVDDDNEAGGFIISRQTRNNGPKKIRGVALWGLSVMGVRGTAIIRRRPFQYHPAFVKKGATEKQVGGFLPVQNVTLWPYTNLQDPRLTFGRNFVLLRQDPSVPKYDVNKLGLSDVYWIAYLVTTKAGARLFIKRIYFEANTQYKHPDRGVVAELFVCTDFCEVEEIGPLQDIDSGRSAIPLDTRWSVHKINRVPVKLSDGWIMDNVVPLVGPSRDCAYE